MLRAGGELDMAVAPQLRVALDDLIDEGKRRLVLDLSEATFIDSTTIGVLVSALRRVRAEGGSIEIVSSARNVRKTFEYAGLDRDFHFHDSLDDARPAPSPAA